MAQIPGMEGGLDQAAAGKPQAEARLLGLSRNVFFLGLVSLLTDLSSEMMFTIMPLFLANVLGAGMAIIGLIEGVAESTATLLKVASGWLSDRLGRRKALAAVGYGLSTIAKPFLYFAGSWGLVLAVRFTDRVGKGIRTSPRDALVAASTTSQEMGRSFGFHRAMDTLGAVIGLLAAAGIVFLLQAGELLLEKFTFQVLVLVGCIPAVVAIVVLIALVGERPVAPSPNPSQPGPGGPRRKAGTASRVGGSGLRFKVFLAIVVIFTLGNISDAFLVLRAQDLGLSVACILLLLVLFNLVYALSSLPAGLLSDRLGRRWVITAGWGLRALTYLGFALGQAPWQVWLLFAMNGLYYGAAEGVTRALVADLSLAEMRGTAYGLYHGAVGIAALPASVIAGWLWQAISPAAPFLWGAGLAGLAAAALAAAIREG